MQLVYQLYEARTQLAGNASAQSTLNQASANVNQLNIAAAHASLAAALGSRGPLFALVTDPADAITPESFTPITLVDLDLPLADAIKIPQSYVVLDH